MATATYPPPPPYYRLYKNYAQDPQSAPEPPPPIEGTYICFGGTYTVRVFTLVVLILLWSLLLSRQIFIRDDIAKIIPAITINYSWINILEEALVHNDQ